MVLPVSMFPGFCIILHESYRAQFFCPFTETRQQDSEEGQEEGPLARQDLQHPKIQDGQERGDDRGTAEEKEAGEEGAEEGDVLRADEQEEEGEGTEGEV